MSMIMNVGILKGQHEKKVSSRNEQIKMDVWLHKKEPLVRKLYCMVFRCVKRGGRRPKKTVGEVVKRDLMVNNISKDVVVNRIK